jgi:hypothetical protein
MPKVLMVKDKPETLFSTRDFEELIDKHMGFECAKHYREQITELSDCIRDLTKYIDDKDICSEVEEVLEISGY